MSAEGFFDRFDASTAQESVLGRSGRLGVLTAGIALAVFPAVAGATEPFWMDLVSRIMVFALFALSLDFVFGYTGLPSFGHAAMFGLGGYASGLVLLETTQNALVALPVAFLVGALIAAVMAWLSVRARGIYFAILTLAFAQLFYIAVFDDMPAYFVDATSVLGGDNGLIGIPFYTLFGTELSALSDYYYLTFGVLAISFVLIVRLANSPFGRVLKGINENEDRMAFIGYNVKRYKIIAFAISGGFTGVAGALFVPIISVAHPGLLGWETSGEVLIMILLGGMGTLWGPMLAAGLVIILEDVLSSFASWQLVIASVYVFVVIFAPKGIAGVLRSLKEDPAGTPRRIRDGMATYLAKIRG
jgi:branched-chain amino acid transport system permease protein